MPFWDWLLWPLTWSRFTSLWCWDLFSFSGMCVCGYSLYNCCLVYLYISEMCSVLFNMTLTLKRPHKIINSDESCNSHIQVNLLYLLSDNIQFNSSVLLWNWLFSFSPSSCEGCLKLSSVIGTYWTQCLNCSHVWPGIEKNHIFQLITHRHQHFSLNTHCFSLSECSLGLTLIIFYYSFAIVGMEFFADVVYPNCCK